jgi:hypothetical protein
MIHGAERSSAAISTTVRSAGSTNHIRLHRRAIDAKPSAISRHFEGLDQIVSEPSTSPRVTSVLLDRVEEIRERARPRDAVELHLIDLGRIKERFEAYPGNDQDVVAGVAEPLHEDLLGRSSPYSILGRVEDLDKLADLRGEDVAGFDDQGDRARPPRPLEPVP